MRRRRNGQALVEFALVAPIFFLLLFGIIEGGRFILYYETLNNATQEGARYAIVHGSRSSCPSGPMEPGITPPAPGITPPACYDEFGDMVKQKVKDTAFGVLGTSVTVTPTWATDNARDSDVTVTATYTYNTLVPLIPLPPISITAESTLVINH